jgi:DNA-binding response OmpR family regulator
MSETTSPKNVLVLEDEPIITRILTRTLSSAGMKVDTAENGVIARNNIKSGKHYDLFLFDIRTPILNGMQLYQFIEENYPEAASRVVFMTGDSLNAMTSCFLEKAKRPVIEKPFTPGELLDFLNRPKPPKSATV